MLDKMTYTNHMNEQITLGKFPYFANYSDLRDFAWEYTETNSKILSFNRGIRDYKLPVVIMCQTAEEGYQRRNALYEIMEKDVLSGKYGTLQIGDYKMQCYVKESAKSQFLDSKKHMVVNLSIITDRPYWTKETTISFAKAGVTGGDVPEEEFLDHPFDHPHDYKNSLVVLQFFNAGFVASQFRMTIYGPCLNPRISVNDHVYEVSGTVEEGQILVVDSIEKTIELHTKNGGLVNRFNNRNKDSYIFEPMPEGNCTVTRNGDFRFDITLIEERSEPKWT